MTMSSPGVSPALRILVAVAGAAIALWGMSQYASYILAITFAMLIALAADPLIDLLRRRGVHPALVLVAVLVTVYAVLGLLALLFVYAGAQFIHELPTYSQQAQAMAAGWQARLEGMGLERAGAAALVSQADPSRPLAWFARLLAPLANLAGSVVTMMLLATFLFVDIVLWPGRLEETARRGQRYAKRLADFTLDLRRYIIVMVTVGAAIGLLNSVGFHVFGVPFPLLWGTLAGILNFVPFIGFWLGLIPPAMLTLLAFGPERMVILAILYVAINAFVQNVIQPRLFVTRLNLTPFMSVVSATFWPLVLGPAGAIVGVPLTMAARALLLDVDPATRWMGHLTSSRLPDEPPQPETPDA